MKKYLLILAIIFGSFSFVSAQNGQRAEKIQELKIAFITQKLQITSAEAEKFWPVYNSYENEIKQLRATKKDGDVLENEQKLLDIRKKYKPSFEKILGPQRANDLYNTERDFRNVLIRQLKEQRQARQK
ncbi:MAG TPA: hypothetical protein VFU62_07555 [Hanamia sp.]|jgi:hypothetical protein|nr:hypothetical protein [Hanamia sp.]